MTGERDDYLAVLKALYDYEATSEDELSIKEDQVLFLVERTDEEWWKVRHKPDSQDDEAGPLGLVPASYLEEVDPTSVVKALYDYEAAAPGELSVTEGEVLFVHDKDLEWLLVKTERDGGKVGYVPGNYVEAGDENNAEDEASRIVVPDSPPQRPTSTYVDPADRVAAAIDKIKVDDIQTWAVSEVDKKGKKKKGTLGVGNGAIFFASESDKTPVQKWQTSSVEDMKVEKSKHVYLDIGDPTPVNLHFNVGNKETADAVMKKLQSSKALAADSQSSLPPPSTSPPPATPTHPVSIPSPLSVTLPGPSTKPNKNGASVHFAQVPAVIPTPDTPVDTEPDEDDSLTRGGMGSALYDFTADGEDELSVSEGEQLIILDKDSSDEWWKCRNMRGAEGVVPASYIEASSGAGRSQRDEHEEIEEHERTTREQAEKATAEARALAAQAQERSEKERERKRQEADRKAKAAVTAAKVEKERKDRETREREERDARERVAAQIRLADDVKRSKDEARPRESEEDGQRPSKRREAHSPEAQPKFPNAGKTRIWHDHSGQWRTEAEFLGISKGKIRLHKINGVVIEVPPGKMSPDDVRYIESITNQKLGSPRASRSRSKDEDDVPLGALSSKAIRPSPPSKKAVTVDWFEFFLNAGCELDDCTRYASSFERDKIDEVILPDIKDSTLRSLGLREGDIIRVMKVIEQRKPKSDRNDTVTAQLARDEEIAKALQAEEDGGSSSRRANTTSPAPNLFAGPGGALKPRRGRPQPRGSAPPVNVDVNSIATASDRISRTGSPLLNSPSAERASPANLSVPNATSSAQSSGFDDDAWTNRPSSTQPTAPTSSVVPASPAPPAPTPPAPPPPPHSTPSSASTVAATAQVPLPSPTSAATSTSAQNSSQFEILAKIGQMKPSVTATQPSMLGRNSPTVISPPPQSFQSGMGMGSSPVPMGQHLQHQQLGLYAHTPNGPRGPLAPVLGNQGLLNPLIPTNTGFNQFVPTRPSSNPSLQQSMQPSFPSPPAGFGHNGPLVPQQTGFPGMAPQQTGMISGIPSQPIGFGRSGFGGAGFPNFMPPSDFGGTQSNPAGIKPSFSQPSLNNSNLASVPATPLQKDHSPANVFAQMKSGTFGEESGPQSSDKYDALRPQPTGFVYQQNGFQQQGPYSGY